VRKIRSAALVAAMLGCVSMFGAGAASAAGAYGDEGDKGKNGNTDTNVVVCEQNARVGDDIDQVAGLLNIATGDITLLGSPASNVTIQQQCSGDDSVAISGSEARTGDVLGDIGITLPPLPLPL
jgi:hypothetical protein